MKIKNLFSRRQLFLSIYANRTPFLIFFLSSSFAKKILASMSSNSKSHSGSSSGKLNSKTINNAGSHTDSISYSAVEAMRILEKGNESFVKALKDPTPDRKSREVFCQNLIEEKIIHQKNDFIKGRGGQSPKAIIIGCSDSRVSPEIIFDQGIGDLFVIRLAGNLIDGAGHPILGSIEYAVSHLNVRLIVVLGHQKCGAINAVLEKILNPFNISFKENSKVNSNGVIDPLEELVSAIKKQINKSEIENALITISQNPNNRESILDKLMDLTIKKNIESGVDFLSKHEKFNHLLNLGNSEKLVIKGAVYNFESGKVEFI